ncbi:MAG: winged helix-turn-helix transcriptional regulator [Candidatus Niyogibacteria bacterium]|nr:winged helix-turn-helix transcriptional regulator [Candidatus Niyogibacteria bacterium]
MKELEKILKALANRRRLAILKYLKVNGEASVAEIAGEIDLSFNATSKHLGILAVKDIVDREQRSLQMFYSLARPQHPIVKNFMSTL